MRVDPTVSPSRRLAVSPSWSDARSGRSRDARIREAREKLRRMIDPVRILLRAGRVLWPGPRACNNPRVRALSIVTVLAACTVAVGPPATIPRPAPSSAPVTPGCDLEPDCGPGCFDLSTQHARTCLAQITVPPRGGTPPSHGEFIVQATTIACERDNQCAIVSVPGCPCSACPSVVAVGTRIPRPRTCRPRVSCTPCASGPSIARCEQGHCVGVVPTITTTL